MKKLLLTTLLSSATIALLSNVTEAEAKEEAQQTIAPQQLKQLDNLEINNDQDPVRILKENAQKLIQDQNKSQNESYTRSAFDQYSVVDKEQDKTGATHYTLTPKKNNITATDSKIKIHVNKNNKITLINGNLDKPKIELTNNQKLTKSDAEGKAFQSLGINKSDVSNIKGYPVISNNKLDINSDKKKLIYNVEINYIHPKAAHWKVQVDANTGEIIKKQDLIENASATGKGTGVNGDEKSPLNISSALGKYTLHDVSQDAEIETRSANSTENLSLPIVNSDTNFDKEEQRAGVDAHYYANSVYNYYLDNFGRNSLDGNGSKIDSVVHYGKQYNNAAWTGQYMIYGDGDGKQFAPLSAANDVVAHELTHAVTEHTAGLEYHDQPGALNESFSDVFGYFNDPDDWLMGEDAYTPGKDGDGLRSLSNPEQYDQPANMSDYYQGTEDEGGVHINSGIPNKAAYLTIKSIGKDKAQQIYYLALTQYLTPNSQFVDAKLALKEAANQLYGDNSTEADAIDKAWNDVGVTE